MNFYRPKGTRDFSAAALSQRFSIEKLFRDIVEKYGYREVQTPTFEPLELFTTKSGDGIKRQLFIIQSDDKSYCLRPEMTAPTTRMFVNEFSMAPKPIKWYYYSNCFRLEEPQSGRYREFWQFGTELIGAQTAQAVAESIILAWGCIQATGLSGVELRVGNINVLKIVAEAIGLDDDDRKKLFTLIDKEVFESETETVDAILSKYTVDAIWIELLSDIATREQNIRDMYKDLIEQNEKLKLAFDELADVLAYLSALYVPVVEDVAVVRGLDYYTSIVFEFKLESLGAEKQICGGGTYSLATLFGGEDVASTGFAIGFDRIMLGMERQGLVMENKKRKFVYIVPIGKETRIRAARIAEQLRSVQDIIVDIDLLGRGPTKCLDYANAMGVDIVIIIGKKELDSGQITIKTMKDGKQESVSMNNLIDAVSKEELI